MEEILNYWKKLSLTDVEGKKISLSKSRNWNNKEYVLAARFFTRRALNVEAVGRTFKTLWRSRQEFTIWEACDHVLLFVFELETDAERVLANEPWSFDKHVVLFQQFDASVPTRSLWFTKMKFWVQIHGLPTRMLDFETAYELGETIGPVLPSENVKELIGRDFLRVRVEVDVSRLLCRGRKVVLENDKEIWVSFKYEKLPNFCYWCDMVSHVDEECEIWLANKGKTPAAQQEYGAWLHSLPYNPGRTPYTMMPGMGDGFGGLDKNDQASHLTSEPNREDTLIGDGEIQAALEGGSGVDFPHASDMETMEVREDLP